MEENRPPKTSKELANAIYDDFKRKAIDTAKKRAVAQNVDYETFKNLVSVAHLKPLQAAPSARNESLAPSWTFNADGTGNQQGMLSTVQSSMPTVLQSEVQGPPSSSAEFSRHWRRNCPTVEHKYKYLHLCGPDVLKTLFKVEISVEVLKDVAQVLTSCWMSSAGVREENGSGGALQEARWALLILEALTHGGRFSLALKLTGQQTKQVLKTLFTELNEAISAGSAASSSSYQVHGEGKALQGPESALVSHTEEEGLLHLHADAAKAQRCGSPKSYGNSPDHPKESPALGHPEPDTVLPNLGVEAEELAQIAHLQELYGLV